jgi:hypothetical protein
VAAWISGTSPILLLVAAWKIELVAARINFILLAVARINSVLLAAARISLIIHVL